MTNQSTLFCSSEASEIEHFKRPKRSLGTQELLTGYWFDINAFGAPGNGRFGTGVGGDNLDHAGPRSGRMSLWLEW